MASQMAMTGGMIKKLAASTILGCGMFFVGFSISTAKAQVTSSQAGEEEPALLFSADEVDYNRELQTVTARSNVEISREGRILLADTVSYDQSQDVMTASGNVSITEPNGEVTFASYVELSGDFKNGIVKDIYILLDENTRIAGTGARRSGGNFTEIAKAVYSPCKVCEDDSDSPPLWRIRAARDSKTPIRPPCAILWQHELCWLFLCATLLRRHRQKQRRNFNADLYHR